MKEGKVKDTITFSDMTYTKKCYLNAQAVLIKL